MSSDALSSSISPDINYDYEDILIDAWNSLSDVETFLAKYNHENGYKDPVTNTKLRIGNTIYFPRTSSGETYYDAFVIVGFDLEHNRTASDGTVYDNGYGIFLMTSSFYTSAVYGSNSSTGGYLDSYLHKTTLPSIVSDFTKIMGSHIIERNVLLSSSNDSSGATNYTWTTSKATVLSVTQYNGDLTGYGNKYDIGEANYKLPYFNYPSISTIGWFRNLSGYLNSSYQAYALNNGNISSKNILHQGV